MFKSKWAWWLLVAGCVVWTSVLQKSAWHGWTWPENVTLAQAGAELQSTVLVVGMFLYIGVFEILAKIDRLEKK